MRVAHILRKYVPAEWGGTETALHRLADGLSRHGVRSVAYCPIPPEPAAGRDPLAESGCEIRRYRACMPVWGLSRETERQMFALGGNILSFELPRMLARDQIDVVHTHALGRIAGIAGTIARRRRLPFVVSIHGGVLDVPDDVKKSRETPAHRGLEWGRVFGWWYRVRQIYDEADLILTCNPREAELLRAKHPRTRIMVHPHGVPLAPFQQDQRAAALAAYQQLAGRDVLLCIARIDPLKNQVWLVQQMPAILQRFPQAHLVLAGACTDAEYGAKVSKEIEHLGLQNRVLRTGGLPPGDPRLIGLLQNARAFVLPSLAEPFGIVIIEAMAAGTPAVVSRTSGALSIVTHAKDGMLFDPAAPESFHQALDRTLGDRDASTRLVAEGRQTAAKYDTAVLAGRLRSYYATIREEKNALRHPA